jgi:hypothetical protein
MDNVPRPVDAGMLIDAIRRLEAARGPSSR